MTVQIKDEISELLTRTLEKLDSNISSEDRKALKVIQKEATEFQTEVKRFLNNNVELGRKLPELKANIPKTVPQVRDLDHFTSLKTQLDEMKNFGESLKLAELRMATIKDKIEIFSSQVDSFMEMPENGPEEESKGAATTALYTA